MPKLIVLVGLPASGKSTFRAKFLAASDEDWVIASTDDMLDEYAASQNMSYNEVFDKAPKGVFESRFNQMIRQAFNNGENLIIDRTSMSAKSRRKYMKFVPQDYEVEAVVFNIDEAERNRRMQARFEATGKSVPDFVINNMARSYDRPTREEGFHKITEIKD